MSCCLRADLNCFSASRYNPNLKRQQIDIESICGLLAFFFLKKKSLLNNEAVPTKPNMNCPKAYFKVICVRVNKNYAVKYMNVTKTTIQNYETGNFIKFGPLQYMQPSGAKWIMMYLFSWDSLLLFAQTGQ